MVPLAVFMSQVVIFEPGARGVPGFGVDMCPGVTSGGVSPACPEGATPGPWPFPCNTRVETPRFATAWHRLADLVIERVVLDTHADGRLLAWISLGS